MAEITMVRGDTLKLTLKNAVLDNSVPNEREPLLKLLMKKAESMGLTPKS